MITTEISLLLSPLSHKVAEVLRWILVLVLSIYALHQVRKPTKWVGRFFLWIMNLSHSRLTDWGLQHVQVESHFAILDVGCGGGRTIQKLAALTPTGVVCGIDYSKGSVAASRARNAKLIEAGRVEINHASVSQLPFPEGKFDLVTAVETQYYWPDLVKDMHEVRRVLKPGGTLIIIAETYRKGANNWLQGSVMKLLRSSTPGVEEQRELFSKAGYTEIQIFVESQKGWICAMGKKPS